LVASTRPRLRCSHGWPVPTGRPFFFPRRVLCVFCVLACPSSPIRHSCHASGRFAVSRTRRVADPPWWGAANLFIRVTAATFVILTSSSVIHACSAPVKLPPFRTPNSALPSRSFPTHPRPFRYSAPLTVPMHPHPKPCIFPGKYRHPRGAKRQKVHAVPISSSHCTCDLEPKLCVFRGK
jgi:hypothetical protein